MLEEIELPSSKLDWADLNTIPLQNRASFDQENCPPNNEVSRVASSKAESKDSGDEVKPSSKTEAPMVTGTVPGREKYAVAHKLLRNVQFDFHRRLEEVMRNCCQLNSTVNNMRSKALHSDDESDADNSERAWTNAAGKYSQVNNSIFITPLGFVLTFLLN